MENIQQYQRAVTPTMGPGASTSDNAKVRGKMLSYSTRRGGAVVSGESGTTRGQQLQQQPQATQSSHTHQHPQRVPRTSVNSLKSLNIGQSLEISGQSKPVSGNRAQVSSSSRQDMLYGGLISGDMAREFSKMSAYLPHQDLEPLSDSVPPDGVLFARFKSRPGSLVVLRLHDERARNPERLNLDRRQLDICPQLEQEQRLRLLNFQNNNIRIIQNLENLPNLIFLDLYNNKLSTLEGSLSSVRGLRVLMVGKNRISEISNLSTLKKLDVLDLHSNDISDMRGLEGLQDLRVLNLAGNCLARVHNISSLSSLTELNLRRNNIEQVLELDRLPALQRVFLSHNRIALESNICCLFSLKLLIELSLDANPIADENPEEYRILIIGRIPSLKHLDLRRVNEDEKALARANLTKNLPAESFLAGTPPPPAGGTSRETAEERAAEDSEDYIMCCQQQREDEDSSSAGDGLRPQHHRQQQPQHETQQHSGGSVAGESSLPSSSPPQGSDQLLLPPPSSSNTSSDVKSSLPQNAFDVEDIGNNEKSLVVVGENWEWAHSKRMLCSVTEAYLRHMKKETIASKFAAATLAWLPALSSLTLIDNDIKTFADLNTVIRCFQVSGGGSTIKHLYVAENPLCQISNFMLKSYIATTIPHIESFNGSSISLAEKEMSSNVFKRILGCSTQPSPLAEDKQQHCGSLDMSRSRTVFQENTWTTAVGQEEGDININYTHRLLEHSFSSSLEKPPEPLPNAGGDLRKAPSFATRPVVPGSLKRGDLEYRFPYRSSTQLQQPASTRCTFAVAPLLPGQQAPLIGVSSITQLVLQRRHVEEIFSKLFMRTVDSVLLDSLDTFQHIEMATTTSLFS